MNYILSMMGVQVELVARVRHSIYAVQREAIIALLESRIGNLRIVRQERRGFACGIHCLEAITLRFIRMLTLR